MKSIYYVAASLDGFIADESGGVSWLDEVKIDHEKTGLEAFYAQVDGLMMGRATYDFVYNYGSWPYADQPCWILSSRSVEVLPGCNRQPASEMHAAMREAQAKGVRNLWVVGGGKLASSLIQAGLLTHIHVTLMPVILGKGIQLIDSLPGPVQLVQESGRAEGGFCDALYRLHA